MPTPPWPCNGRVSELFNVTEKGPWLELLEWLDEAELLDDDGV